MSWSEESFSGIRGHQVSGHDAVDSDGNPAGGNARDGPINHTDPHRCGFPGILIRWQDGPVADRHRYGAQNGAFVEDVLLCVKKRIEFYQASKFACMENAQALESVQTAIKALEDRRKDRRDRGVEGKHEE